MPEVKDLVKIVMDSDPEITRVAVSESKADEITESNLYYGADHGSIDDYYDKFLERFYPQLKEADEEELKADVMPIAWFAFQNLIQDIIEKKVGAIPKNPSFSYKPEIPGEDDEDGNVTGDDGQIDTPTTDAILALLDEKNWGGRQNFWGRQDDFMKTLKVDGDLFLKLTVDEQGKLNVSNIDASLVRIIYNPGNVDQVYGYIFDWTEKFFDENGEEKEIKVQELITNRLVMKWEEDEEVSGEGFGPHDFPFIPVEHIPNRPDTGKVFGESDVDNLIEPMLHHTRSLTDYRIANLLKGAPVFAAEGLLADIVLKPLSVISVLPGGKVQPVTGMSDLNSVEHEIELAEAWSYRKGKVMRKSGEDNKILASFPSARALLTLDREGVRELEKLLPQLITAWESISAKGLVMTEVVSASDEEEFEELFTNIVADYPSLDSDNIELVREKVQVLVALHENGDIDDEFFFTELQRLGFISDATDPAVLAKRAQDRRTQEGGLGAALFNSTPTEPIEV